MRFSLKPFPGLSLNNSEQNLLGVWPVIPKGHGPVS